MPLYPLAVEPVLATIATHLATQYGQSIAYTAGCTNCAMRGAAGTKCAVGALISDEQLERFGVRQTAAVPELGNELLDELQEQYAPEACGPEFVHALMMAQRYHDGAGCDITPSYSARLEQYAKGDKGLQPKILEDLHDRYCGTRFNE